jgi:hypothetical protein
MKLESKRPAVATGKPAAAAATTASEADIAAAVVAAWAKANE